jgi:MarR-like DNA-binding transcriptional regulator SgrR of sgrS sRNA
MIKVLLRMHRTEGDISNACCESTSQLCLVLGLEQPFDMIPQKLCAVTTFLLASRAGAYLQFIFCPLRP